jgi:hypothetical protein
MDGAAGGFDGMETVEEEEAVSGRRSAPRKLAGGSRNGRARYLVVAYVKTDRERKRWWRLLQMGFTSQYMLRDVRVYCG